MCTCVPVSLCLYDFLCLWCVDGAISRRPHVVTSLVVVVAALVYMALFLDDEDAEVNTRRCVCVCVCFSLPFSTLSSPSFFVDVF